MLKYYNRSYPAMLAEVLRNIKTTPLYNHVYYWSSVLFSFSHEEVDFFFHFSVAGIQPRGS